MKQKIILVILLSALIQNLGYGKTIDQLTAQKVAGNFLISAGGSREIASKLQIAYTASHNNTGISIADFYVFNTGTKGFVIIAADDRVQPVLAYSKETTFDSSRINPAARYWLGTYREQVKDAINKDISPTYSITAKWQSLSKATVNNTERIAMVSPLVTTLWNQSPYYNDLCPLDPIEHQRPVTGCVATAMAQVMKYWNWPPTGCGYHTYTDLLYGQQTVNYSATNYQWLNMPDNLDTANVPIATLMYHAGVSVNMDYNLSGSGAWVIPGDSPITNTASMALQTYFHYKHSLIAVPRWQNNYIGFQIGNPSQDSFTNDQWVSMLQEELNAGRPVIYTGSTPTEGHCWVCDGYENNEFFHFNWGWGGLDDGYYTLNKLVDGLNQYQEAIFGIEPDSFPSFSGNIQLQTILNTGNSPICYGSPFALNAKVINKNNYQFSGVFTAAIYDTSGQRVGNLGTENNWVLNAGAISDTLLFSSPGMYNLPPGTYSISLLYHALGDTTWAPVANNGNFINQTILVIANDTNISLCEPIHINNDSLISGNTVSISVSLIDIGLSRFTGNIELSLYDLNSGALVYTIGRQSNLFIIPNLEYNFTFIDSSFQAPAGKYMLMVKHQYDDSGQYYITGSTWMQNPVEVTIYKYTNTFDIYPNPAKDLIYFNPNNNKVEALEIMDMEGRKVLTTKAFPANIPFSVPVQNIPNGCYLIKITTSTETFLRKIILSR